jgi:transposase
MRFYTKPHQFYWGLDLHARTMYLCLLNQEGEVLLPRKITAAPQPLLTAIAPYREELVVGVECLCTWSWLADLCAQEGMPFVLGHALYRKAIHGGKAQNDTSDAHTVALLRCGGMMPRASVSPAERRATRDLLRRRLDRTRKRAALLTQVQQTTCQDNWPALGNKLAYKAHRLGVAERFPDPAVQKSLEVDLARIDYDDQRLRDRAWAIVTPANPHDANTLYWLRTVPGRGQILSLVLLYELHDSTRFPRGQAVVPYCRLVTWAKGSAGKRYGTSATKVGNASLPWALKRRSCSCATPPPATSLWPAERENTARARR